MKVMTCAYRLPKGRAIGDVFVVKLGSFGVEDAKMGAFSVHSVNELNWTNLCWNAQVFVKCVPRAWKFQILLKFWLKLHAKHAEISNLSSSFSKRGSFCVGCKTGVIG